MPVRPELLDALGMQETGGEPDPDKAVSIKGARGRYQITPPTARAYGFDPTKLGDKDYSRNAASTILAKLIDQHKGDEREALKSYYGRGKPPKGHPTADEYADKVLKMAGSSDPFSEALAKEKTGSTDPFSEALAKEKGTRPQIKTIGKPARSYPGVAPSLTPENVQQRIAQPFGPAANEAQKMALGALAGGPAAELGEAALGPAIGGVLSRSAGLGALGGAQSFLEKPTDPHQAIKAAGWNFGFGLAGEAGTSALTKGAAAVGPYAKKIAGEIGELTPNKVKALFHIKQFLKAAGRTPEEVDAFTRGVEAKQTFADAHQAILDETHKVFNRDYGEVLDKPEVKAIKVKTENIKTVLNEQLAKLEQENRIDQLSPGIKTFIKQKQEELDPLTAAGYRAGSKPTAGAGGKSEAQTVDQLRALQSQIRGKLRGRATATDRALLNELHNEVGASIDDGLTAVGTKPEDLAKLRAVDNRYRQFQQTVGQLDDPRQALTGAQAAKAMFDAVETKNYGAVDEYVKLAKAAAVVQPKVLTDLKDAVLTKVMADARETAAKAQTGVAGRIGEMRKLQSTFANQAPEAMATLFGKDSPMADVGKTAQIFGRIASPEAKQEAMMGASKHGGLFTMLSPQWLARWMLIYSTFAALSGSATSPWQFPRQNPMAGMAIGLGMLFGPQSAKFIFSRLGSGPQQAYTNWILEPGNPAKLRKMVDSVAAGLGHATAQPAEQQQAAMSE